MNVPTIAKANIIGSYATVVGQPVIVNGIADNTIMDALQGSQQIYNLRGQTVKGTLTPGIYVKNGRKMIIKK